jgi:lipopolysaccharide/colanic/teichoic acid biosynthesis glycosyltransferase
MRSPASRGCFRLRFSLFDTIWALGSPIIALAIRDAYILSLEGLLYCFISLAFTLIAYSAFRLHDGVSRFFSVHEAWAVVKAVACAELMTGGVLFTFTRLDNIPRSIPLVHALILCAGLIAVRALARSRESESWVRPARAGIEHVIMVGSTHLTFLFVKFLAAYCPGRQRVIAVLDSGMVGRSVSGIRVVGPPEHLQPIIDEFAEHGISTGRVVIGGDEDLLPESTLSEIRRVCEQRRIALDFVPRLVGLSALATGSEPEPVAAMIPAVEPSAYFRWKYALDLVVAGVAVVVTSPLFAIAGVLALLDVGSPVVFWQQRLGERGRTFVIYKMRTLRPPFDQLGQAIPPAQRLSWVGRLLRRTRLDELPQLLNVLVGEMSLVGPRPLLPRDQPEHPSVRLLVRPGITGWAQVNGGTLLSPSEKDKLDEWYVRNASFWLDVRIVWLTVWVALFGQRRSARATAPAVDERAAVPSVMAGLRPGLGPATRVCSATEKTWMPGTRPGTTGNRFEHVSLEGPQ